MQAAPPKKKEPRKRQSPESTEGTRPGQRQHPAIAESTDEPTVEPTLEPEPEREEPESSPSQPVTNHDEQEKITNADTLNKPDTNF